MRKKLLIIDDDQMLLKILKKMFEKVNPELDVLTFINGRDALAYLNHTPNNEIPILLVDIYLEDMDGWEFLEEIESDERFHSKVFLITSSVGSQNFSNSQQYKSVGGFFQKPITFEVIETINGLIGD